MKNHNEMRMIWYGRQDCDRWPASKAALQLQLCLCIAIDISGSPGIAVVPLHYHWHRLQPREGGWALEAVPHWWLCLCIAIDISSSPQVVVVPWRQSRIGGCASALPLASAAALGWRLRLGGSPALVAVPLHCHWHRPQPSGGGWALEAVPHWWLCLCIAIDIGYSPAMVVGPWRHSRIGGCASGLPLTSAAALWWGLCFGGSPALVAVPRHCHWHRRQDPDWGRASKLRTCGSPEADFPAPDENNNFLQFCDFNYKLNSFY